MLLPRRQIHEVLVIGSGASGGWVAKELTERGLTVVMLEAGPPRVPTRDFTEHIWPYQLKFRGFGDQQRLLETQPVQRLCFACDEYSHQFFVNDLEHPYTFPADKPFMWIRGRQVGGKDVLLGARKLSLQRQRIQSAQLATATAKTGPSATRNSSPTTTWSKAISASADRAKACRNCPTGNSCRP